MREIPLSELGLITVAEACAAQGWPVKTVQNWIKLGLLPAVVVGAGRSAKFLLRESDVSKFAPPARGRPRAEPVASLAKSTRGKKK